MEAFLTDVKKYATLVVDVPDVYQYPIDPKDSHYVNLALAANARLIVSRNNHLLGLMDMSRPEGQSFQKRFSNLTVVMPPAFLHEVVTLLQPPRES